MNTLPGSIEIICPNCRAKTSVEVRWLEFDLNHRCQNCEFHVFVDDTTRQNFYRAVVDRDVRING